MGDDSSNNNKAQVLAFDREKRVYKDAYVDNFRKVRHFPALATIGAGRSDGESIILVQEPLSLQQQPQQQQQHSALTSTSGRGGGATTFATPRRALEDVPSRLLPPDSVRTRSILMAPAAVIAWTTSSRTLEKELRLCVLVVDARTSRRHHAAAVASSSDCCPFACVFAQLEAMFESTPPLSSFRSAVLCKHTNARLSMGVSPFSATTPTAATSNRDVNRYALQVRPLERRMRSLACQTRWLLTRPG